MDDFNQRMAEQWQAVDGAEIDGDLYLVCKLIFHVMVIVNPEEVSHGDRFCYHNVDLAMRALNEKKENGGPLRYWKKYHSKGISVGGSLLYRDGDLQTPENAIGSVDWNSDELAEQYPYQPGV